MEKGHLSGNEDAGLLKCCFKRCPVDTPRCSRGSRCAKDVEYAFGVVDAPACPACHVACSLYDPQCARGIGFRERWQAGEDIPKRRRPPMGGPVGGARGDAPAKPDDEGRRNHGEDERGGALPKGRGAHGGSRGPKSTADKLMFLLSGVVPRVLGRLDGDDGQRLLSGLSRQGGAMSREVIAEKTRIDDARIDQTLDLLVDAGLVEPQRRDWGATYYWVTDEGASRRKGMDAERDKAVKETFSALSDEEQEELASLLDKLLAANRQR